MSNSDGDASDDARLSSDVRIEVSHLVAVDLVQARFAISLSVNDIVLEELLRERHGLLLHLQHLVFELVLVESPLDLFVALRLVIH